MFYEVSLLRALGMCLHARLILPLSCVFRTTNYEQTSEAATICLFTSEHQVHLLYKIKLQHKLRITYVEEHGQASNLSDTVENRHECLTYVKRWMMGLGFAHFQVIVRYLRHDFRCSYIMSILQSSQQLQKSNPFHAVDAVNETVVLTFCSPSCF